MKKSMIYRVLIYIAGLLILAMESNHFTKEKLTHLPESRSKQAVTFPVELLQTGSVPCCRYAVNHLENFKPQST